MSSFLLLLPLLALVHPVLSTPLDSNLAYRSPYANVPSLGHDTPALHKRHHSAGQHQSKRHIKRQAQTIRPSGSPDTYTLSGYAHSVASGDPFDYSVLLWTRAVPVDAARTDVPTCVTYSVYDGLNATGKVVSSGYALSSYDVDFTFKVEATGLEASKTYSYQFANCAKPDQRSPIGRTRTAPGKHATGVEKQSFAVYSCSNYPNGFFNSYGGPVANDDVQYVVHLGDYIYEYGTGGTAIGRVPSGAAELVTLHDYRARYAQYRTDPDLAENHRLFPWINIWDDHETANNDDKSGSSDSSDVYPKGCTYGGQTGVCFTERAANAKRAYHEWIPIRQVDVSDEQRIWRDFRFGDLLDVIALDTRKYDRDVTDRGDDLDNVASLAVELNSTRSITGLKQEEWFLDTLGDSLHRDTQWRLVLNQVIFGSLNYSASQANQSDPNRFQVNYDSWDGYQRNRLDIMQWAYDNELNNTVVVTGDTHANWLFENSLDSVLIGTNQTSTLKQVQSTSASYQRGQIVEFGGTAVSSNGWGSSMVSERNATAKAGTGLVKDTAGLLWTEGFYRGYMNLEISYDQLKTTYWAYPDNQIKRTQNRTMSAQFVQLPGKNQVERPLSSVFGAIKAGN